LDSSGTAYIWPEKSVRWLFYEKLHVVQIFNGFRIVHTMRSWLKIAPTASKPLLLDNILYNFYLDNLQYIWHGFWSGHFELAEAKKD